jgi:hypothetical protein
MWEIILSIKIGEEGVLVEEQRMSTEQESLLDVVRAVYLANKMMGKELNDIYASYHYQAVNGQPGWNIFLNNMRFELGYNRTRLRLSLPITNEEDFGIFAKYLEEALNIPNYSVDQRQGLKYLVEIDFDENIYTDEGLGRISRLTDKVLEYAKYA